MSDLSIGILGFAGLFVLMILRTPVAFAMLLTGFFGIWFLDGLRRAGAVMMTETYSAVGNYSLIVVPMFILLGNVASEAGFSRGLYDAAHAWVGRFRGGLATASVIGCAAFSAVSGSSVATAVTIGRVALPEMRRLGYGDGLSTVDIGETIAFHKQHGRIATLTGINPAARFGELKLKGDAVESFAEKPDRNGEYVNGGFFVFDRRIFDYLDADEACDLELGALEDLAKQGELMIFRHDGFWGCMDTQRDADWLRSLWAEGKAPWKRW